MWSSGRKNRHLLKSQGKKEVRMGWNNQEGQVKEVELKDTSGLLKWREKGDSSRRHQHGNAQTLE